MSVTDDLDTDEEEEVVICFTCDNSEDDCECCGDCECYPCECCDECSEVVGNCNLCWNCNQHIDCYGICEDCQCSRCEEMNDECSCGHFGTSEITPWERRGIKVNARMDKNQWDLIWPEINTGIDPVQAAANFYLLESISAGIAAPIPGKALKALRHDPTVDQKFFELYDIIDPAEREALVTARNSEIVARRQRDPMFDLQWVMGDAEATLERIVEILDETMVAYSHMAIAGELRHHSAVKNTLSDNRDSAWCGWRKVYDKVGNQALLDAATLFYEFQGGGYGGPPWAQCCEVLHDRLEGKLGPDGPAGKINKRMFIDRIWTLEHNGGCFLNKIVWSTLNKRGMYIGNMRQILDAHASDPTEYKLLLSVASTPVVEMYRKYIAIAQRVQRELKIEESYNPLESLEAMHVICNGCGSDPKFGHYYQCGVMMNTEYFHFAPDEEIGDETTAWYTALYGNDHQNFGNVDLWIRSQTEPMPFNARGVWSEPVDKQFTVNLEMSITSQRGYNVYHASKTVSFIDLLSGAIKWHPKRFGKNDAPHGAINDYAWIVTVSSAPKKTYLPTQNFKFSGMGHHDPNWYQNNAETVSPEEWIATPINVSTLLKNVGSGWSIEEGINAS